MLTDELRPSVVSIFQVLVTRPLGSQGALDILDIKIAAAGTENCGDLSAVQANSVKEISASDDARQDFR